jgi:3-(3-hydroxy-phenyl)propionate hydroxylase
VLHFTMPQDENQKLPPMVNLAQYSIEQILLDKAETQPGPHRHPLADPGDRCRGARRRRAACACHARRRLRAASRLGVAADGGRSFLREALGLKLEGTSYEGRYVIVDILLDSDRPTERLAYFDPACNPGSTVLVHKQPGNVWRIDYQLRDGEDPDAAIQPENVMPRVESLLAMMGEKGTWKPIWSGIYKANALTLAELSPRPRAVRRRRGAPGADLRRARRQLGHRRRRQPGLEAGFVVKGLASNALLDSYSASASPRRARTCRTAPRAPSSWRRRPFAFELMRTAVLGLAKKHPSLSSLINPRRPRRSPMPRRRSNAAPERSAEFAAGPVPGAVLPECPLTDRRRLPARAKATSPTCSGRTSRRWYFSATVAVPAESKRLDRALGQASVPFKLAC